MARSPVTAKSLIKNRPDDFSFQLFDPERKVVLFGVDIHNERGAIDYLASAVLEAGRDVVDTLILPARGDNWHLPALAALRPSTVPSQDFSWTNLTDLPTVVESPAGLVASDRRLSDSIARASFVSRSRVVALVSVVGASEGTSVEDSLRSRLAAQGIDATAVMFTGGFDHTPTLITDAARELSLGSQAFAFPLTDPKGRKLDVLGGEVDWMVHLPQMGVTREELIPPRRLYRGELTTEGVQLAGEPHSPGLQPPDLGDPSR